VAKLGLCLNLSPKTQIQMGKKEGPIGLIELYDFKAG
jgi:hypothetical protein